MANIKLALNDREAGVIRRALMLYAENGADGDTTTAYKIHKVIANEQVEQTKQDEWERYCLNRVAPFDGD